MYDFKRFTYARFQGYVRLRYANGMIHLVAAELCTYMRRLRVWISNIVSKTYAHTHSELCRTMRRHVHVRRLLHDPKRIRGVGVQGLDGLPALRGCEHGPRRVRPR